MIPQFLHILNAFFEFGMLVVILILIVLFNFASSFFSTLLFVLCQNRKILLHNFCYIFDEAGSVSLKW